MTTDFTTKAICQLTENIRNTITGVMTQINLNTSTNNPD